MVERKSRCKFDFASDRRAFRQFSDRENCGGCGLSEHEHFGGNARCGMFGREYDVVKSRFGGGIDFGRQQIFVDVTMRDERERGETFLFCIQDNIFQNDTESRRVIRGVNSTSFEDLFTIFINGECTIRFDSHRHRCVMRILQEIRITMKHYFTFHVRSPT